MSAADKQTPSTGDTAVAIADALRVAADRASNLLEQLGYDNESMKSASLGVLPDGTPVEDMLEDLREIKAREARLRSLIRSIRYHTNAKSAEAYQAIKKIRQLLDDDIEF